MHSRKCETDSCEAYLASAVSWCWGRRQSGRSRLVHSPCSAGRLQTAAARFLTGTEPFPALLGTAPNDQDLLHIKNDKSSPSFLFQVTMRRQDESCHCVLLSQQLGNPAMSVSVCEGLPNTVFCSQLTHTDGRESMTLAVYMQ